MTKSMTIETVSGKGLTIGIVKAQWNTAIIDALHQGAVSALEQSGVDRIVTIDVPGSFELPYGAKHLIETARVDAVICLGVLIKGETMHFEYISESVAHAIQNVGLTTGVPVIFGVLTCLNEAQAIARSVGDNNHGIGWGKSAVAMARLKNPAG